MLDCSLTRVSLRLFLAVGYARYIYANILMICPSSKNDNVAFFFAQVIVLHRAQSADSEEKNLSINALANSSRSFNASPDKFPSTPCACTLSKTAKKNLSPDCYNV